MCTERAPTAKSEGFDVHRADDQLPDQLLQRFGVFETRSETTARHETLVFVRTMALAAIGQPARFHLAISSVSLDGVKLFAVTSSGHGVHLVDEENVAALVPLRGKIETDDGRGPIVARPGDVES